MKSLLLVSLIILSQGMTEIPVQNIDVPVINQQIQIGPTHLQTININQRIDLRTELQQRFVTAKMVNKSA